MQSCGLCSALHVRYENGTTYGGGVSNNPPITMAGDFVVVVATLRPDLVYSCILTVRLS